MINFTAFLDLFVGVTVILVNQRLKITFDRLVGTHIRTLNQRANLDLVFSELGKKSLDHFIIKELFLTEAQNLKSLFFGHEFSLNPKPFYCYLLAAFVSELFHHYPPVLLLQISSYLLQSIRESYFIFLDLIKCQIAINFIQTLGSSFVGTWNTGRTMFYFLNWITRRNFNTRGLIRVFILFSFRLIELLDL